MTTSKRQNKRQSNLNNSKSPKGTESSVQRTQVSDNTAYDDGCELLPSGD